MSGDDSSIRLRPSRVLGLEDVREVAIHVDRLEVDVNGVRRSFAFADMGRRQEPAIVSFIGRLFGKQALPRLVGEREWCSAPQDRFFRWYTDPPLTVFMPADERESYSASYFPRIHAVLHGGRFTTFDLA